MGSAVPSSWMRLSRRVSTNLSARPMPAPTLSADALFRELWGAPDVREHRSGFKGIQHPSLGTFT